MLMRRTDTIFVTSGADRRLVRGRRQDRTGRARSGAQSAARSEGRRASSRPADAEVRRKRRPNSAAWLRCRTNWKFLWTELQISRCFKALPRNQCAAMDNNAPPMRGPSGGCAMPIVQADRLTQNRHRAAAGRRRIAGGGRRRRRRLRQRQPRRPRLRTASSPSRPTSTASRPATSCPVRHGRSCRSCRRPPSSTATGASASTSTPRPCS